MTTQEKITDTIISALDRGIVPWKSPYLAIGPRNFTTPTKCYSGMNVLLTACAGFDSPYWLTYNQAVKLGGQVTKGSKATPIVYYSPFVVKDRVTGDDKSIPMLKHFNIFNARQISGIEFPEIAGVENKPIGEIETFIQGLFGVPEIRHTNEQMAFYNPREDYINVPSINKIQSTPEYYSTLFHEIGHSTGHGTRLARPGIVDSIKFASHSYSKEELIAEITSAFLCAENGLSDVTLNNSASYCATWAKKLGSEPKVIFEAVSGAKKAIGFLKGEK